jgi:hypothetical protein
MQIFIKTSYFYANFFRILNNPDTVSKEGIRAVSEYKKVLDMPDLLFSVKMITPRKYIQVPLDRPMKFAIWVKSNALLGRHKKCIKEPHHSKKVAIFVDIGHAHQNDEKVQVRIKIKKFRQLTQLAERFKTSTISEWRGFGGLTHGRVANALGINS